MTENAAFGGQGQATPDIAQINNADNAYEMQYPKPSNPWMNDLKRF